MKLVKSLIAVWIAVFGVSLTVAPIVYAKEPDAIQLAAEAQVPGELKSEGKVASPARQSQNNDTAKPRLIPTAHFANRGALWNAKLSPDGESISFIEERPQGIRMVVTTADSNELVDTLGFAKGTSIQSYEWIDNDRMMLQISGVTQRYGWYLRTTRLVLAEPKKGKFDFLISRPTGLSENVVHIDAESNSVLVAHRGDGRFHYPTIFRYELKAGSEPIRVEKPKKGVWSWHADNDGVVRLGVGWYNRRIQIWYRSDKDTELRRIARFKPGDEDGFFDAIEIVSGSDRGYVLDEDENGRVGVRVYDYAKREVVGTFYENSDWDVDELWMEEGKPLAAFYTDDREQVVWFDDEYRKTHKQIRESLPGMQVNVTSRSETGDKMLVWANSEADPGVLYLFDRKTNAMEEMAQYRPKLDFKQLASPKAFTYAARDGTDIRAYLTLPVGRDPKNLPLIIHPHGGPFGIRDQLRYDDQVQFLANRGYAVIQPNFRGSGGYGNEFYDLGIGQVGRGMQDDLDDAMDWAVKEGIADPARVCVIGGSYGGYAAIWAVLRNPERYRCAASWAGVTDWDKMLSYDRRTLTNKAGKRWQNKIEGDDNALDLKDVSPYRLAENLNRPVLLAHGSNDSNVPIKQFELMKEAAIEAPIPPTTLVIEGEGHSFSKAESEQKWYDALDAFLAEHNPADQLDADGVLKAPKASQDNDLFQEITLPGAAGGG